MKKVVNFTKEINFKTMISKITSISLEHTLRTQENNLISGHFIVEGTYKMTQASQIDEEFSYKIPVDIEIDQKYDVSFITLDIDDFKYEILDEDKLKIDISLCIDNLEEKKELDNRNNDEMLDDLFLEETPNIDLEIIPNDEDNESLIETTNFDDDSNNDEEDILEEKEDELTYQKSEVPLHDDLKKYENSNINDDKKNNFINCDEKNSMESLFSSFKDSAETFKTYYVYVVKEGDTLDSILLKYKIDMESVSEYNDLSDLKPGSKIIIPSIKNE